MKRLIVSVFLFSVFSNFIYSQEWAPTGAKWYYTWLPEPITGMEPPEIRTIEVVGDTVILGKQCKILEATDALVCYGQRFTYSENDSIFFYDSDKEKFELLYDFTASVNDSWDAPLCVSPVDTLTLTVKSIYTSTFDSVQIKTYEVDWSFYWNPGQFDNIIYEGIGNASRMYMIGILATVHYRVWNLRCYDSPSTGLINFLGEPCDQIVPTTEERFNSSFLELYPSPANDFLKFKISNIVSKKENAMRILNYAGNVFYEKENVIMDAEYLVAVSNWPTGIYLLQFFNGGQLVETKRFVIVK